jgi:ribosomal protein S18 acetylase RimI-like enzyme
VSLAIRRYRAADESAVYDICVHTGDDGHDATGKFADVRLLSDIYAGPYLYLEPDLAFVLADDERPVGYVIGTAGTAAFVESYRDKWLPRVASARPAPPPVPVTADEHLLATLYHPERMLNQALSNFPAHLHIDVLPAYQGGGHGRRLIETFVAAVTRAGAGGLHVAVSPTNTRAHGFYLRVGFERLDIAGDGAYYYGVRTGHEETGPGKTGPGKTEEAPIDPPPHP